MDSSMGDTSSTAHTSAGEDIDDESYEDSCEKQHRLLDPSSMNGQVFVIARAAPAKISQRIQLRPKLMLQIQKLVVAPRSPRRLLSVLEVWRPSMFAPRHAMLMTDLARSLTVHHHDYLVVQSNRLHMPGYNRGLVGSSSGQVARQASSTEEDDEAIALIRPAAATSHKQRRWDEKEEAVIYYKGGLRGAMLRADHGKLLRCTWQNHEGGQEMTLEARKQCLESYEDYEREAFVVHEVSGRGRRPGVSLTLDLEGNVFLQPPPSETEGSLGAVALGEQLNLFFIFAAWITMKARKLV